MREEPLCAKTSMTASALLRRARGAYWHVHSVLENRAIMAREGAVWLIKYTLCQFCITLSLAYNPSPQATLIGETLHDARAVVEGHRPDDTVAVKLEVVVD